MTHQVLTVVAICTYTGFHPTMPLLNCFINHHLFKYCTCYVYQSFSSSCV